MQELANNIAPTIILFFTFFLIFSLIEILFILILNYLKKRHWEFVIDKLIRLKVHYGKLIGTIFLLFIILLISLIYWLTPFFLILQESSINLTIFYVTLLIAMILIYITTTRKMEGMALEKRIHSYIYFITSFVLYVVIVIASSQSYITYQSYINQKFVNPTVKNFVSKIDKNKETKLLERFRKDYMNGKCESVDYSEKEEFGITHFVYIKTDIELTKIPIINQETIFKGAKCTNGESTFLLTENGKWFWVIVEKI